MKRYLSLFLITILCVNGSFAQLGFAKKKKNDVSVDEILKHVAESEEKRAYKPEEVVPFYSPEQRDELLKKIRNAKTIEDIPVITTIAYYPMINVTKLISVANGITDKQEVKWNSDEMLKIGDTICVYGTYNLGQFMPDHVPSISDLKHVAYKNRLVRITPNHDDNARFISASAVEKCFNHRGEGEVMYAYEGRKDTILLREEYLKGVQTVK